MNIDNSNTYEFFIGIIGGFMVLSAIVSLVLVFEIVFPV